MARPGQSIDGEQLNNIIQQLALFVCGWRHLHIVCALGACYTCKEVREIGTTRAAIGIYDSIKAIPEKSLGHDDYT